MSTRPCPHCTANVPEGGNFCGQCGRTIDEADTARDPVVDPSVLAAAGPGSGSLPASQVPTPRQPGTQNFDDTTRRSPGMDVLAPAAKTLLHGGEMELPPRESASFVPSGGTMLGMPAKDLPPPAPDASRAPAPHKAPDGTLLGVAIPGVAPTHQGPVGEAGGSGTILGVAVPGIAPSYPPPHGPSASAAPRPRIVPPPAPPPDEPLPDAPRLPSKKGIPAVALVAIVMGIVLILGAAAALFVFRSGTALMAQPQLDDTGRESLRMTCESCPNGTVLSLGASSATVEQNVAVLPLPAPLSIGENVLRIHVRRPSGGREEDVEVQVPVSYRVRADLSTLSSKPPAITVRVEAPPGSQVRVEDMSLVVDASGRAAHAVSVAPEAEGTSDEQRPIDRKIPFSITLKAGKTEGGILTARAAIAPLRLEAPGLLLFTDRTTAPVAGQTRAAASVTVNGQSVQLDAQGRFGARVELPEPGEKVLEIVASSPPLATRTAHAKVVRVASLEAKAKELAATSPATFAAFGDDPQAAVGKEVVVEGLVVSARGMPASTSLVVEERRACPSGRCLVSVQHGQDQKLAVGDSVRLFGRVTGGVAASGQTKRTPEVEASLLLPLGRTGK